MSLESKKILIHEKAVNSSNAELIESYKDLQRVTMWQYHNDQMLSKLSSNYDVAMLSEDFQSAARSLLSDHNFVAILIDKMLNRDAIIAYSMYKMLYEKTNPELILDDGEMLLDNGLTSTYLSKGGDLAALTEMNAELWLTSRVGESYLAEDSLG